MKIIFTMMLIVVLSAGCNLEFLQGLKELNDKYCSETNADKEPPHVPGRPAWNGAGNQRAARDNGLYNC